MGGYKYPKKDVPIMLISFIADWPRKQFEIF